MNKALGFRTLAQEVVKDLDITGKWNSENPVAMDNMLRFWGRTNFGFGVLATCGVVSLICIAGYLVYKNSKGK